MATPESEEILKALQMHNARSDERMGEIKETVKEEIAEIKHLEKITEGVKMEPTNIFTGGSGVGSEAALMAMLAGERNNGGVGAGAGAGLGAGLLGGILGGALLGNRGGLFGNNNGNIDNGIVTPALLASSLANVTETQNNSTLMQTLGDIKASVPLAEGQVQLALAGGVGELRSHLGAVENTLTMGQTSINKNISDAIASSLASQNNINVNVLQSAAATRDLVTSYGVANLTATKDSQYATQVAISNSTKEILTALNDQNVQNLQRQLSVAESALFEQRAAGRSRDVEVNVSQSVTQNQAQLQAQAQAQQQFQILAQLAANVNNLANDIQVVRQTQSNVNFGTQTGNSQTATNNRVN